MILLVCLLAGSNSCQYSFEIYKNKNKQQIIDNCYCYFFLQKHEIIKQNFYLNIMCLCVQNNEEKEDNRHTRFAWQNKCLIHIDI